MNQQPDKFERAVQMRKKVAPDLMRHSDVVACGVGYKITHEEQTDEPAVVVSVRQKRSLSELPESETIPTHVDGVKTDVVAVGEVVAHSADRISTMRPVRPGLSIGHVNGTAGTFGAVVERDGQQYILSANHVLALLGDGSPGDSIYQPGPADGGTAANIVAVLEQAVPIQLSDSSSAMAQAAGMSVDAETPQGCAAIFSSLLGGSQPRAVPAPPPPLPEYNLLDAAIAKPVEGISLMPDIIDTGGPPLGIRSAGLQTKVIKSGRTSGLTQGAVIQTDVTVDVRFGDRIARFEDQVMTSPLSLPGDSGSLVLDYERYAVGLLFSGSDSVSIFTPITTVLRALNVTLVTG